MNTGGSGAMSDERDEARLQAERELECLKMKAPDIYEDFVEFFERNYRAVGYKKLCKMLMGKTTGQQPESAGN